MITDHHVARTEALTATADSNATNSYPSGARTEDRVCRASWAPAALSIAKSLITLVRYKAVSVGSDR
ncbi:hypothetical protein GCM10023175_22560 [Pseudonocardia xishanensis]|uniref:Uncharacterized protein n=1 Tax=Pseudonocardia xishanensis TaxID=630995 RepID=A0ABP8RQT8_9PSEU